MCPEQTTPAWCDQCRKYQPTNQTRKLKTLPRILSLNAGMVSLWCLRELFFIYLGMDFQGLFQRFGTFKFDRILLTTFQDNPQDVVYWQTQMELEFGTAQTDEDKATNATPAAAQQPPPNAKPCRYGNSCTRPDCKFWHPEADETTIQQSEDISNKCARLGQSWIPHQVW